MINIKSVIRSIPNHVFIKLGILLIDKNILSIIVDLVKILGLTKNHQLTISNLYSLIQLYKEHENDTFRNKILKLYYFNLQHDPIYCDIVKSFEIEAEWDESEWGDN